MKRRIVTTPRYDNDLEAFFALILQDKAEPAYRFLKVAQESIERLAEMPTIGTKWETSLPQLQGVRSYPMPDRFRNYLIFYKSFDDRVEFLAILHGARDLATVLERLI
jgi:toxin ParE1/3/4